MSKAPGGSSGWRAAVPRLSRFALEHLLLLPLGALIAIVWVNADPENYYQSTYAMTFAVNDIAMVFFFALMTKEVVEATAPKGVLHPWRRALLPVIAAIGATVVPALLYTQVVGLLDEPMLVVGWPVHSDRSRYYFVARIIFRKDPLVPFPLLCIASDVSASSPGADRSALGTSGRRAADGVAIAFAITAAALTDQAVRISSVPASSWFALFPGSLHQRSLSSPSCRSCRTRSAVPVLRRCLPGRGP